MMHIHQNSKVRGRTGSIVLEIAIVTPVFLLLAAFMLTAISCVRADILFSQAVDQVTQELAVAVPVAGAGIDLAGEVLSIINAESVESGGAPPVNPAGLDTGRIVTGMIGGVGAILEALGIEGEDIFGTLLFGEGIRNRIVDTFYSYCPSDKLLRSRIENVSVYVNYDGLNNVIWLNIYYQWNTLFGMADRTIVSAVPIFGDLDLTLPDTSGASAKDEVWLLNNFERGYSLRSTFEGNLPLSYPVIAGWNNGTATSIKSVDLTAPGYQLPGTLTENIRELINDLSAFEGTDKPWGKDNIQINTGEITSKVLLIIIPGNSPQDVYDELASCITYAELNGVQIRIEKYGDSYRYIEKDSADTAE